jgi:hypothetical protein
MAVGNNTFNVAGNNNWTCPANVTTANIEIWAGGGGGGGGNAARAGGGGGGGAYARVNNYNVTAGHVYSLTVGGGGNGGGTNGNGTAGGNSVFRHNNGNNLAWAQGGGFGVRAGNGGNGGAGGAANNSSGNNVYSGGAGGTRPATGTPGSGGGGADNNANGANANGATPGNSVVGGDGGAGTENNNGAAGGVPGGGGGGGDNNNKSGGAGGVGTIFISFNSIEAPPIPIALSLSSNISAGGNGATTNLLTAPSGKNNSSFQAGKISDDTNPLPAIDLGANNWTEVEFCIQANSSSVNNNDVFKLRLSANGVAFNNYTVAQANWTIGAFSSNNNNNAIIIPLVMHSYRRIRV